MPLSAINQSAMDVSKFTICINHSNEIDFDGKFYNCTSPSAIKFENLGSMILKMDKIMDTYKYPIQSNKSRSFVEKKTKVVGNDNYKKYTHEVVNGKIATINIVVESRQSSQWQCKVSTNSTNEKKITSIYELVNAVEEYCGLQ